MINYIKGIVTDIEDSTLTVENNGIGYLIYVPTSVISSIRGIGNEVKIYTYMNVKEDALDLYGFLTKDELKIFKQIIGVSGIGPKGGISLLSCMTVSDLRFAVLSGDSKSISKANGIGAKTAQKLIIELKDKIDIEENIGTDSGVVTAVSGDNDSVTEAIMALTELGYSQTEAAKAVSMIGNCDGMNTEMILKAALKKLAFM